MFGFNASFSEFYSYFDQCELKPKHSSTFLLHHLKSIFRFDAKKLGLSR